jgi:integrase
MKRWKTWKLAEVEPADVRSLFGQMRRDGVSTVRLKRTRAALSAMFATAVDDGLLRSNPIAGVRIPAPLDLEEDEDPQIKAMTREQLGVILFALPAKWQLFFELLTHSGLRIGEAVGLRWEHVDLGDSPRLLVREQIYKGRRKKLKSKAGKRDIPLSPGMARQLLAHRRDSFAGGDAPVFATGPGNPYLPQQIARDALNPAREAAGLGWVTFHSFRHTCASLLFDEGRNVKQVSEWLGHADPSFTLRTYVHLLDTGVGGAEFFDSAVRTQPGAGAKPPAPAMS